jgi:hypothetical protein
MAGLKENRVTGRQDDRGSGRVDRGITLDFRKCSFSANPSLRMVCPSEGEPSISIHAQKTNPAIHRRIAGLNCLALVSSSKSSTHDPAANRHYRGNDDFANSDGNGKACRRHLSDFSGDFNAFTVLLGRVDVNGAGFHSLAARQF